MKTEHDPLVGQKIGRYPVTAFLGRGRGAAVYSATDPVIGRVVAIKILDRAAGEDGDATARFLRDAERLAQLWHPHILPIYDFGERDGRAYLVRQHIDGGTLRDYLREAGTLDLDAALAVLRPIATALDYAHRQGFVHGNLRPSNIVRTKDGQIYLTDFVVPGAGDEASAASTIVSAIDDPTYASPERAREQTGVASIDHYVLGVIVYEALTGQPPFQIEDGGDTARHVLARHLQDEPPSPRAINPSLGPVIEAVLLRALAKRPDDRYPTGAALIYALNEASALDREQGVGAERRASRPITGPLGRARPITGPLGASPGLAAGATASPATVADERVVAATGSLPLSDDPTRASLAVASASPTLAPSGARVAPVSLIATRWQIVSIGLNALLLGLLCGFLLALW